MDDSAEEERGNVSLPPRLQTRSGGNAAQIINMQTAYYDILIKDGERDIERLENRNNELLSEHENAKIATNSLDVESGDEIARLKKFISLESDKVDEIQRKIDNLERLRDEERQAHQKNVDSSNKKYENTRIALTLSIKALNAKINTLEDYKHTRGALLEKLRIRDDTMQKNEEETAQKQDAVDRKFKIDREKLKNEMFTRLLDLAGKFQLENSDALALPIHRLMRENIFIRAELSQFVDESLRRKEDCTRMRTMEVAHRHSIRSNTRQKRKTLINAMIQRYLLKILKKMHSQMKQRLAFFPEPSPFLQECYDRLYGSAKAEYTTCETRRAKLEVLFHRKKIRLERAKYLKRQTDLRTKIYEEIFYDVKYAVACALQWPNTGPETSPMKTTELISRLLYLFANGQSQIERSLAALSVESVPHPHYIYAKGDLGFEPEQIDLGDEPTMSEASLVEQTEKIILDSPATFDETSLPTTSAIQHELEETRTRSTTSTRSSDNDTSVEEISTEAKESRDDQEDILDPTASDEDEESFGAESENQDGA